MKNEETTCTLSDKRKLINGNGNYVVRVTCDSCGHVHSLTFSGWTRFCCLSCGLVMKRTPYMANGGFSTQLTITTREAAASVMELDRSFVGTRHYMGFAYFWAHEYKHTMRECSAANRQLVHSVLLAHGLVVHEISDAHCEIVQKYAKPRHY